MCICDHKESKKKKNTIRKEEEEEFISHSFIVKQLEICAVQNVFPQHRGSFPTAGPGSRGRGFDSESPLSRVGMDWDRQGVPGSLLPTLWCE